MNKLTTLLTGVLLTAAAGASAAAPADTTFVAKGNPFVNYKYLGDPAALVHDGKVYIYMPDMTSVPHLTITTT